MVFPIDFGPNTPSNINAILAEKVQDYPDIKNS